MTADLDDALEVARTVVREACDLLRAAEGQIQTQIGEIRTKSGPRDLVTEWDMRVEELIRERLGGLTPEIALLAEETGPSGAGESELRWLIDPIDGTLNFSHGLPLFGVTVALERAGAPVVGVVAAPAMGWEFYGRLGGGAFMGEQRLAVSKIAKLERAVLATGFPPDRVTTSYNFAEWEHFQRRAGACRRFGAASLDLAMVARGWLDGYWESRLSPWDLSAGALLIREAGGQVTDYVGGPFRSETGAAVASNGLIHQHLIDELAAVQSRR